MEYFNSIPFKNILANIFFENTQLRLSRTQYLPILVIIIYCKDMIYKRLTEVLNFDSKFVHIFYKKFEDIVSGKKLA
jgi:hypothetical protein